jgi:hypothetical protein
VQWECFPGEILNSRGTFHPERPALAHRNHARTVPEKVTQLQTFPGYLRDDVQANGNLYTYANGEIHYEIKGVHAKVSVLWNFEAPEGAGDTHFSVMRGSKANLVIRQGAAEGWQPVLTIEPATAAGAAELALALQGSMGDVCETYPGIDLKRAGDAWQVVVSAAYHVGHEAHFAQVATQFLSYVEEGALPDWEVPNMIAKYRTTTQALEFARGVRNREHERTGPTCSRSIPPRCGSSGRCRRSSTVAPATASAALRRGATRSRLQASRSPQRASATLDSSSAGIAAAGCFPRPIATAGGRRWTITGARSTKRLRCARSA